MDLAARQLLVQNLVNQAAVTAESSTVVHGEDTVTRQRLVDVVSLLREETRMLYEQQQWEAGNPLPGVALATKALR